MTVTGRLAGGGGRPVFGDGGGGRWIPAFAGMTVTGRLAGGGGRPVFGDGGGGRWIPAFAGMTGTGVWRAGVGGRFSVMAVVASGFPLSRE